MYTLFGQIPLWLSYFLYTKSLEQIAKNNKKASKYVLSNHFI